MFSIKRGDLLHERLAALESKVETLQLDLAQAQGRLAGTPSAAQILAWVIGVGIAVVGLAVAVARVM
jgi:tetrahydromethanopterin S-methyltransferase subunit G